ncbi:MAG: HEPN domain-containing protein [Chloroflexi bacterium]|nr:HEPN domain-containing protein [Chloroflexota bacterium]
MSPTERFPPDDPREWLNRARSNLALARSRAPGAYPEDLCFEAQQAAEKAIKSILIARGIDFPYVHDLTRLVSLLEEAGEDVPDTVFKAGELTPYALLTRYPGPVRAVTTAEYEAALEIAEAVVEWAAARS